MRQSRSGSAGSGSGVTTKRYEGMGVMGLFWTEAGVVAADRMHVPKLTERYTRQGNVH